MSNLSAGPDPLRPESGILDRRNLGGCAVLFPRHQGEALDEADTLKIAHASAECADCGGLRKVLAPKRRYK